MGKLGRNIYVPKIADRELARISKVPRLLNTLERHTMIPDYIVNRFYTLKANL